MTGFRVFKEVYSESKIIRVGLNLIYLVPSEEGKLGHRYAQREDNREDGRLEAKVRDFRRKQPCRHLDLDLTLPSSRTVV